MRILLITLPSKRVIIQEITSLGKIPSPFGVQDLYKPLQSIPCFISLLEGPYGFAIVFNHTHIFERAARNNISPNRVIKESELIKIGNNNAFKIENTNWLVEL